MVLSEKIVKAYLSSCKVFDVNPYDGFSFDEVRMKYRSFAKLYHPDINKTEEAAKKMQKINNAFNFLKNNYNNLNDLAYYANEYQYSVSNRYEEVEKESVLNENVDFTWCGWSNFGFSLINFIIVASYIIYYVLDFNLGILFPFISFTSLLILYIPCLFLYRKINNSIIYFVINILVFLSLIVIFLFMIGVIVL